LIAALAFALPRHDLKMSGLCCLKLWMGSAKIGSYQTITAHNL